MKLLALETSAACSSVAVTENGRVLARGATHVALTHSQTLLPLVQAVLSSAALTLDGIDGMAVAAGPGSFTGVRIGVAALKGLAFPRKTPCVGVSTLAAMARLWEGVPFNGVICAAMDARCQQIYTARFACENGAITRLTPDEARPAAEVGAELAVAGKPVLLVGDGAELCYRLWQDTVPGLTLAPAQLRFQDAVGVALEAAPLFEAGQAIPPEQLQPAYLRLPQAERELRAKQAGNDKQKI